MNEMKKMLFLLFVVVILCLIRYSMSRLNITVRKNFSFEAPDFQKLEISNVIEVSENEYLFTVVNPNDYDITFKCITNSSYVSAFCKQNIVAKNTTRNIEVSIILTNVFFLNEEESALNSVNIMLVPQSPYKDTTENLTYSTTTSEVSVHNSNVEVKLSDYITTSYENGASDLVSDNGIIRYIGSNPNNYVIFNGEKWRIIGLFDNSVKIVSASPLLQKFTFDNANNDFSLSSLYNYLNTTYYNELDLGTKSMINQTNFYLGGFDMTNEELRNNANAQILYNYERGNIVFGENASSIPANIGLIYASDYAYATGGEERNGCLRSSLFTEYSLLNCEVNNYLYNKTATWVIHGFTVNGNNYANITSEGTLSYSAITTKMVIYPSLYLKDNVGIINDSADGSSSNPYKLRLMSETSEEKETIQVTFDTSNDSVIEPLTIDKGSIIASPEIPIKTNYTFDGWQLNGEIYNFDTPINENVTLVAKWIENTYEDILEKVIINDVENRVETNLYTFKVISGAELFDQKTYNLNDITITKVTIYNIDDINLETPLGIYELDTEVHDSGLKHSRLNDFIFIRNNELATDMNFRFVIEGTRP